MFVSQFHINIFFWIFLLINSVVFDKQSVRFNYPAQTYIYQVISYQFSFVSILKYLEFSKRNFIKEELVDMIFIPKAHKNLCQSKLAKCLIFFSWIIWKNLSIFDTHCRILYSFLNKSKMVTNSDWDAYTKNGRFSILHLQIFS